MLKLMKGALPETEMKNARCHPFLGQRKSTLVGHPRQAPGPGVAHREPELRAAMLAEDAELAAGGSGGPLVIEALANVVAIHLIRHLFPRSARQTAPGVNQTDRSQESDEDRRAIRTDQPAQASGAHRAPDLGCIGARGLWRNLSLTGQRLADLATLRWDNIDMVRNEIWIKTRKTGKRLLIPIFLGFLPGLLLQRAFQKKTRKKTSSRP
jgi:integrase